MNGNTNNFSPSFGTSSSAKELVQLSSGSANPVDSADFDLFDTVERSLVESARRAGEADGREAAWREAALQGAAVGAALARHAGDVLGTVDVALELLERSGLHSTTLSPHSDSNNSSTSSSANTGHEQVVKLVARLRVLLAKVEHCVRDLSASESCSSAGLVASASSVGSPSSASSSSAGTVMECTSSAGTDGDGVYSSTTGFEQTLSEGCVQSRVPSDSGFQSQSSSRLPAKLEQCTRISNSASSVRVVQSLLAQVVSAYRQLVRIAPLPLPPPPAAPTGEPGAGAGAAQWVLGSDTLVDLAPDPRDALANALAHSSLDF